MTMQQWSYLCLKVLDMLIDLVSHLCFGSLLRVVFLWCLQALFAESFDLHLFLANLHS